MENNYFTKFNVSEHEYYIHNYVYKLGIVNCPKIISYDWQNKVMVMEKIDNMSIADFYGADASKIPKHIFDEIRQIINALSEYNIEYIDITGYNFIEFQDKIWIIDFEHAEIRKKEMNHFLKKFLYDSNEEQYWNPDFL
jgi:tRNA A-37 threonylcarbamoyl transferase component Bud32